MPTAAHARGFVRPAWALPSRLTGAVAPSETLSVQVHLRMRNEAEAEAELAAISDPKSPRYGAYLTDAEFDAKYAPTEEDVAAVRAHLEAQGLSVTHVAGNRAYVAAVGTAQNVQSAFSARLGVYDVRGAARRAPIDTPTVPGALGGRVLSVLGLSSPVTMAPRNVRVGGVKRRDLYSKGGHDVTQAPPPCSEWYGAKADATDPPLGAGWPALTFAPCGMKPPQVRAAYGFTESVRKGNDGTGVTVAIVDAFQSPTLLQDAQIYAAQNDPDYPLRDDQFKAFMAPGTPSFPDTGWYTEQSLDVESVHAAAPGANIVYVGAQSATDQDLVAAIHFIVDKRLATIVSNSYGSIEASSQDFVVWQALATQAGLKGVGIYFSSGDSGDNSYQLGVPSADFPASLAGVTAVGGTSVALGKLGQVLWETGWETGYSQLYSSGVADADAGPDAGPPPPTWQPAAPGFFQFGAGGGTSNLYEQPAWQSGIVPDKIANIPGTPARVVPDVAMVADPVTGLVVGQTDYSGAYSEQVIGGTSLACPLFAGVIALAEQQRQKPIGFANPALYAASNDAFRDVTPTDTPQAAAVAPGIATTFNYGGLTITTAVGYDNVTGLGSPNGTKFLRALK